MTGTGVHHVEPSKKPRDPSILGRIDYYATLSLVGIGQPLWKNKQKSENSAQMI